MKKSVLFALLGITNTEALKVSEKDAEKNPDS